jgi:hypothetical protein
MFPAVARFSIHGVGAEASAGDRPGLRKFPERGRQWKTPPGAAAFLDSEQL